MYFIGRDKTTLTAATFLIRKSTDFNVYNFSISNQKRNITVYLLWVKTCGETGAGINRIFQFMFHIFNVYILKIFQIARYRRHLVFVLRPPPATVSKMAACWGKLLKFPPQIPRVFSTFSSVFLPKNIVVEKYRYFSSTVSKNTGLYSHVSS